MAHPAGFSVVTTSASTTLYRSASVAVVPTTGISTQKRTYCAAADGQTALDVAMKVNKLKRLHQTGQGEDKKRIEQTAWRELNTLTESQIEVAEGKAVALILSSWAYFSKFWEKGKDGPFVSDDKATQASDRPEA